MKVSAKQANYIMHKRDKRWTTYLFHWTLVPIAPIRHSDGGHGYRLYAQWKKSAKILVFIISALVLIPLCCWEEGLKHYPNELEGVLLLPTGAEAWPNRESSIYKRAKEIYRKNSKHE